MSNEDFDAEVLTEKLAKLNTSQQSIESLSQWCLSHRKKAKQIVETWDKFFNSSQREKCISLLYLANDILQNSRRKGSEFVNEFWKVLPAALKHVYNGGESGKKVVIRLVDIWEERKVFGSRGHGLKDELLGKEPPVPPVSNGKSSNPIKILKKDATSIRIKLAVGALPEKILTAFQSVLEENPTEDVALNKCSTAAEQMGKIVEEAENALAQGQQQGSNLEDDLQDQENMLLQCIGQLESAEATRAALVSQLTEAVHDQESKLELIRSQLQVARGRVEQANRLRKRLTSPSSLPLLQTTTIAMPEVTRLAEQNLPLVQPSSTSPLPALTQPVISFPSLKSPADEESKKAAVAAVAAKLAASTSSAQMFTSVLSSLVAEEAASMNGGLKSAGFNAGLPLLPPEKRPKLEKPMPVSEANNSDITNNPIYFASLQKQSLTSLPLAHSTSMTPVSQPNPLQASFASPPPPPPPPVALALSSGNPSSNQYVQPASMMAMPYGYGSNPLPPPPPLPPHVAMPLTRPLLQPPQQPQSQPEQPQQPGTGGYYRPLGVGFFGQSHQSATSPVPRQ